jgi:nitroimidazol reductase NimA-like FMN-containing flavoprotein (pyridoxamine 5'-phosphate oxidase superfamily)
VAAAASMAAMTATPDLVQTDRTKLRRLAARGSFDRAVAHAVLDEAYLAHVGFVVDGEPRVLPMTYGRDGDVLYLHGAVGNAMLRASAGAEVCVTVTLLDGLVLARSAFHHSMNYRSVVLLGRAEKVEDEDEKRHAFDVIVDHVVPGRHLVARPTSPIELQKTIVLRLPIEEGSAKVRAGDAIDDDEDLDLPVWAGVVPLRLTPGAPVTNADLAEGLAEPPAAELFAR